MIKQKICKKGIVEALNRYEKHSLAGRRKIKPFLFLKMARENTRAVGIRARLSQSYTKLVLVSRKPSLFSNLTNPINKTFMRLIHLINSTFLSLKIIVDTLIDVGKSNL